MKNIGTFEERTHLVEFSYALTVINLPAFNKILDRRNPQLEIIVNSFKKTYQEEEISFRDYIDFEVKKGKGNLQRAWIKMSPKEKEEFWVRVEAIQKTWSFN